MATQGELRHRATVRRGATIVYLTLCLPVLFLMVSLAVDFGRAQSAKTQLQAAVDAAARAAAVEMMNFQSTTTARSAAVAVAAANTVDGSALTLQSSDVVFGYWDPTARTFTAGGTTTNAVKISATRSSSRSTAIPTLFAAMLGRTSVDIRATATIYVSQEMAPFNALGNATFNHTGLSNGAIWATDSYVGNLNTYSNSSARQNGNLLTNGNVTYNFTTPSGASSGWGNRLSNTVMGTIYSANGADCTKTWTNNARGSGTYWVEYGGWNNAGASTQSMGSSATFTTPVMPTGNTNPTIPGSYLSGSNANGLLDLNIADGSTVTLPGGTYTLNSLSISNGSRVSFSGPVTLNIATNMTISGAQMLPQVNDPKYLAINLCTTGSAGSATVTLSNLTQNFYADLNAPKANFTFSQSNNGNSLYGRVTSNNMTFNCTGNGGVHGNESLLMAMHVVK